MISPTLLVSIMIASGADAHGQLTVPRVRPDPEGREVSHKQRAPVYTLNGPAGGYSATSMRCHDFISTGQLTTVTAGSSLTVTHTMEARHPGDCYFYISYDGANPVNFFKIAAVKGCGAPDGLNPPTPYTSTIDLPAALPPCDHCVLRWEWTAHQQVVNIEFYVQCADIKIVSNSGPTKPSPMVAISGIDHLPSSASSYRNPYNGQFGDNWLVGPNVASFSSCSAGSAGCIGTGISTRSTTAISTSASTTTDGVATTTITTSTSSSAVTSSMSSTTTTTSTRSVTNTVTKRAGFSTTTSVTALPTTSTITTSTFTTKVGSCDDTCVDSMGSAACRQADVVWNMCSAGSPWWTSRCQATCAKCGGVLPPCGQCDHKCTNTQSEMECERLKRLSAGALCSGGWGAWWQNQCRASCGACDGTLPPCNQAQRIQSFSMALPIGMAPSNSSSSAQDPFPQKVDNNSGFTLILLGISNGVLLLCLLASGCVIINGKHAKKFEL